MKRRAFITLLGAAAAPSVLWPLAVRAQQGGGMRRIGVLMPYTQDDPEDQAGRGQHRHRDYYPHHCHLTRPLLVNARLRAVGDCHRLSVATVAMRSAEGRARGPAHG